MFFRNILAVMLDVKEQIKPGSVDSWKQEKNKIFSGSLGEIHPERQEYLDLILILISGSLKMIRL